MRKAIKVVLVLLAVIALGMGLLIVSFLWSMKPDKDEEEKIRGQAEVYIEENFNKDFEIYDVLYDNMGNFTFDYAAKVRDKKSSTEFLVYYDENAQEMVDTFVSEKWAAELESEIRPYVSQLFGDSVEFHVFFDNLIGRDLAIDLLTPGSYKEHAVSPVVRLSISRNKEAEDEQRFAELISFLQNEGHLQQGTLIAGYVAETGEILEDEEWSKEF
ncbi:hypothetical protein QWY16_06690 [Planococcus shenhongbingii]|uniref:hypothetical protein n=1 Tax=Planococcus shenhongbingii TaxID=3058398 RepID=UPI002614A3DC|nr:hypothetical protein [Planococcus sp. N016]WKA59789.1 hypothetical protein QWY16_06690 [Planococcus sp. N016]